MEILELTSNMFCNAFYEKRVLVTGHTGFKGSWLCNWLTMLGANVYGLSLPPTEENKLFQQIKLRERLADSVACDVRDKQATTKYISLSRPDFLFHLAAQPLVRRSYSEPTETFDINILGTANVLEGLRTLNKKCTAIIVTTDKCYENQEWLHAYRENDALGGHDPYSASKACAEIVAHSYRRSFFLQGSPIKVATARAGNVIGGGDWAEDRIFPDILRAIRSGEAVKIRNKTATRPWQHVLEPLSGYMWLAAKLDIASPAEASVLDSFNFGPNRSSNKTVEQLVQEVLTHADGSWTDCSDPTQPHEASLLNLSIDKAHHLLEWHPVWNFTTTIKMTMDWYQSESISDMIDRTNQQTHEYKQIASSLNLPWSK